MDSLPGEETGDKEQTKWSSLTTQEGPQGSPTGTQGLERRCPLLRAWNKMVCKVPAKPNHPRILWVWARGQTGTLFHLAKNANNVLGLPGSPREGKNKHSTQQSWQVSLSEGKSYPRNPNFTQSNGLQAEHPHPAQAHTAGSTWTSQWKDPHLQDRFSPKVFLPLTLHHLYLLLTDSLTPFTHWVEKPPSQAEEFAR